MAETVEELRAELEALRADFQAFKDYAKPVIDGHQPEDTARKKFPPTGIFPNSTDGGIPPNRR